MEFSYRLTGTGWAEAWVADGSITATITASYLEDALGELRQLAYYLREPTALVVRGRNSLGNIGGSLSVQALSFRSA